MNRNRSRFQSVASLLLALALAGCASAAGDRSPAQPSPPAGTGDVDSTAGPAGELHEPHGPLDVGPRLLVLTAMDSELAPLLTRAEIDQVMRINGREHHLGRLGGVDVVMAATGVSMVNATMATQAVIDRIPLTGILFCGIAGTPSPEMEIGDVTVAARWAQYQEHVFTDASRRGWRRGWRDGGLGNYGMMHPQQVWSLRELDEAPQQALRLWFPVGEELLEAGREVAGSGVELIRCNEDGHCVEDPEIHVGGNGVSGPTFVDDPGYREFVWEAFQARALDMETAAVGHVAYTHEIPYVAVRAISDLAGGNAGENRVTSWLGLAAHNAAAVTERLLERWGTD